MATNLSTLFLLITGALLLLLPLGVLLWRRYYRDDPTNQARRVVKNSAVPLAMRLLVRALDMAFFVVLQRSLPGAEIGPYNLAALFVGQYLATITEFGLGVLLTREAARDPTAAARYFGTTLALRLGLVVVLAVPAAALLIGGYGLLGASGLGEALSDDGRIAIWILLLTLIPSAYSGAVTALFNAAERMEVPALVEVITAVIGLLARLAVLLLGFGILGISWVAVLVSAITALIYLPLQLRNFFPPTLRVDRSLAKFLIPAAIPLMLNNLLNAVFFRFDVFIIKAFGGGQGDLLVNQYDVAYKVLSMALILPPVVTFAVFPLLSRRAEGDRADMARAQNMTLQALLLLAFPMATVISVLAAVLVVLINGRNAGQFLPVSANILAILAWFLPFSFINGLLQYTLIAVNRQVAITRAFVVGALFNLVANLILVPQYGLYAAAVITIVSELVLLAMFWPVLRQEGLTPPLLALSWRPLLAALLMSAVMALTVGYHWLLALVLGSAVYLAMLWLLGAFGPNERAIVRRVLGRSP